MTVIEIIGYGKKRRYIVRETRAGGLDTVPGTRVYKTEQAARQAAAGLGLTVEAVGDLWQLIK